MSHLETLSDQIVSYGVRHVFGIPGSGPSLTLIDHLCKKGVNFHLVHFEGCAAIMAGTVGRLSGKCGVSVGIKGPGLANMIPGIAACSLESLPAVNITEAYLPDAPLSSAHKRIDHSNLVSSVVKESSYWSESGSSFQQLAENAEAECPGPVHMNITGSDPGRKMERVFQKDSIIETNDDISQLLEKSLYPVLIVGSLAIREGLSAFLNLLKVPVFTTASAKGVVNETLPHAAGVFTGAGLELSPEVTVLPKADLVIAIGLRHNEVLSVKKFGCKSILLDPLGNSSSGGFAFPVITWMYSRKLWNELWDQLEEKDWGRDEIAKSKKNLNSYLLAGDLLPANIFQAVDMHFAGKARIVVDTGLFCTVAEHIWSAISPSMYISSGQGRYMGISLPQGVAAALFDSTVPTVIFCGDGSVGMFIAELKIAIANALPLIIVLLSDGKFGTLRGRALKDGLTEKPLTVFSPSWVSTMEGLGIHSVYAESVEKCHQVLGEWDGNPLFIEVLFDSDEYARMTEKVR
ncbi:thiamine pyrophosphate-dependent enzyme, possible carboligase or decarboxylase [Desulfocapsa sulfexigens DSM 10523]|uniref:Thiamine pyrophosphate-dependent enzyme, possible carboligase or decarboxylase n=1 Tax=Desulfocapsa sulfexigens (strain DSM 10523 / SB164P1) TaxID=1167006 RepID=M1NH91_DESSD|nr:thiamine pyrophosphate-binding protein [Desulfocapsa sulfexigens]AGF78969.1 thiamine pyrophosphate-dependent enzyme, possible carboligase or decarboxylase [Desulfocapsa sulfexigens DSM 10523]